MHLSLHVPTTILLSASQPCPPAHPVPFPEAHAPPPLPFLPPLTLSALGLFKICSLKAAQSPFCRRGWNTDSLFACLSVIKLNLGVNTTM